MATIAGLAQAPIALLAEPLSQAGAQAARHHSRPHGPARLPGQRRGRSRRSAKPLVIKDYARASSATSPPTTPSTFATTWIEHYGADALQRGGLRVEAAVEPVTDALAYDTVDYGAHKQDKRQGWRGPVASLDSAAHEIFFERAQRAVRRPSPRRGRRYLALVDTSSPRAATVRIGVGKTYELPLSNMRWASPWSQHRRRQRQRDHQRRQCPPRGRRHLGAARAGRGWASSRLDSGQGRQSALARSARRTTASSLRRQGRRTREPRPGATPAERHLHRRPRDRLRARHGGRHRLRPLGL